MSTVYQLCLANAVEENEEWFDLADLGVSSPERVLVLAGTDTLTFTVCEQQALTSDTIFSYNAVVRFRRVTDGTQNELLFLGRCDAPARTADPSESYQVTVRGMWHWFENTVMRQDWTERSSVVNKPRVVLFCDEEGDRITTGAQLIECANVARTAGCPIAAPDADNILDGYTPPYDEQVNISVADAVCKCLANHPHASLWFDYSERDPVMHVETRTQLPALYLSVAGKAGIAVKARNDLQPPAVAVCFERENTVDGKSYRQTDVYYEPHVDDETAEETNARLSLVDVLWGVYDLQGSQRTNVSQDVEVEDLPASLTSKTWWKARLPWLADYADGDITITDPTRSGALNLPAMLVGGAIAKWMDVDSERETFEATADLTLRASGGIVEVSRQTLRIEIVTTDAVTKTYSTVATVTSGESVPSGIVPTMWSEWGQLHYEGSVTHVAEECSTSFAVGYSLCLTNGRAEWETMCAMISRVTARFDTGETTVEFGVPGWVDIDSRVAWYRACRTRNYSWSRSLKESSSGEDGVGGVKETREERDGGLTSEIVRRRYFDPAATVKHEIDLNAKAESGGFEFATAGNASTLRVIRPREFYIPYWDETAGAMKAKIVQVLCSEPYDTAKDLGGGGDGKVKGTSDDPTADYLTGKVEYSIAVDATSKKARLVGDASSPGQYKVYGTDSGGTRGWQPTVELAWS